MPDNRLTAPTLRKHCRGNYYVRLTPALGGGSEWFGRDESTAHQRYKAWADRLGLALSEGKTSKLQKSKESECVSGLRSIVGDMPRVGTNPKTIQQVAESLYKSVDAKSGSQGVAAKRKVRACLVRPLAAWGSKLASDLTADDLIDFQSKTAAELAPNSANDVLTYTRRLLAHAWLIDAVAEPFKTPLLANVSRPALTDKTTSLDNLKKLLRMIAGENPNLARALLTQFYMVGRPSELPSLVHATEDKWESEHVCAIHGKTTRKTGEARRLLLTDAALSVLAKIERTFGKRKRLTNGYSYRHLCWKVGEKLKKKNPEAKALIRAVCGRETLFPHRMRHHAVQALIDQGVSDDARRVAMGHCLPKVTRTYGVRPNCKHALASIEVLGQLIPPSVIEVTATTDKGKTKRNARKAA